MLLNELSADRREVHSEHTNQTSQCLSKWCGPACNIYISYPLIQSRKSVFLFCFVLIKDNIALCGCSHVDTVIIVKFVGWCWYIQLVCIYTLGIHNFSTAVTHLEDIYGLYTNPSSLKTLRAMQFIMSKTIYIMQC